MSRARHAKGGKVKGDIGTAPGVMDTDSEPASRTMPNNVMKEGKEKSIGKVSGAKSAPRMDRPQRKSGGKVDMFSKAQSRNPMSAAADPISHKSGGKC